MDPHPIGLVSSYKGEMWTPRQTVKGRTHPGQKAVRRQAEIRMMPMQAKAGQGLPAAASSQERPGSDTLGALALGRKEPAHLQNCERTCFCCLNCLDCASLWKF